MDVAGRPVDFFERPEPTAYIMEPDENTKFLALYNFEDKLADIHFDLDRVGMRGALVANCLTHQFIGFKDTLTVENANPHSGAMFLLRKPEKEPAFVGADTNIFMGLNQIHGTWEDGRLTVNIPENCHGATVYTLWPDGYTPEGEILISDRGYTLTKQ